jgi:serpin B
LQRQDGLSMVNQLWVQQACQLKAAFLETARTCGAPVREVDFSHAEDARALINAWVLEQTKQLIAELLPTGSLTSLTRLVLTNAVHFKANWQVTFPKHATKTELFNQDVGPAAPCEMMHLEAELPYAERHNGVQVLEMPYATNNMSMVFILPVLGESISELEAEIIDPQVDDRYFTNLFPLRPTKVRVSIPRFTVNTSLNAKACLQQMGIHKAFEDADFSGISDMDLVLDNVYHKTSVTVDEVGSEAAAATAATMLCRSISRTPSFTADRPFLYFIRERTTGEIFFFGRVATRSAFQGQ